MLELNKLYNMDCMDGMKQFPDNYFNIAIVDPPYGGGAITNGRNASAADFGGLFDRYDIKATRTGGGYAKEYSKHIQHWDIAPSTEYFQELFRVSKEQIIWGGNYFALPPTRCFIVWRKPTISESFSMAMCEYAWASFNDNAKYIEMTSHGMPGEKRFHPTQKPVALYQWLLSKYAKPGDKILDTHAGSASSLIACHRANLDFIGFEMDPDYYAAANDRLLAEQAQIQFDFNSNNNNSVDSMQSLLFMEE